MGITIEDLRARELLRSYNWTIDFQDGSNLTVLCNTVNFNHYSMGTRTLNYGNIDGQNYSTISLNTVVVKLYEDQNLTVLNYIDKWVKSCISRDGIVTPPERVMKMIRVSELDLKKDPLRVFTLYVVPSGELPISKTFDGSSGETRTLTFNIMNMGD